MLTYKVKVLPEAQPVYLWGGDGIEEPLEVQMILTVQVCERGAKIKILRVGPSSTPVKTLGVLRPGETYSIPLKSLKGVFVECDDPKVRSHVLCTLTPAAIPEHAVE